ncbi:MAG: hypothetical protein ACRETW_00400 [Stenotrophobium sp.]
MAKYDFRVFRSSTRVIASRPVGVPAQATWAERGWLGGILLLTALVYLRSLHNGFVLDDTDQIVRNHALAGWSFLWRGFVENFHWFQTPFRAPGGYYRPLQGVVLGLGYHLFGTRPMLWHVPPIIFHLLATVAAFRIARTLLRSRNAALLATAGFALAPIQVGTVGFVSAHESLAAVLLLWSFALAINAERWSAWTTSALFYCAALLSFEGAIVLPALIVLYRFCLITGDGVQSARIVFSRRSHTVIGAALLFVMLTLLYLALRIWVLHAFGYDEPSNVSTATVLMTVPAAIVEYLRLLVWPFSAGPVHPLDFVATLATPEFYSPLALLLLLTASTGLAVCRSMRPGFYVFCIAWIAVSLAPALLVLAGPMPPFMIQDRYLYVPALGWFLLIAGALDEIIASRPASRNIVVIAAAVCGCAFVITTWRVQGYWKDDVAFYSRCLELAPNNPTYHSGLAWGLLYQENLQAAEYEFAVINRLTPGDMVNLYNLGVVHARMGRCDEAMREIATSITALPTPPAQAYIWLTKMHQLRGKTTKRDSGWCRPANSPEGRRLQRSSARHAALIGKLT